MCYSENLFFTVPIETEGRKSAPVKMDLDNSRFGFLDNYYSGMLDMYSDFSMSQSQIGLHVETLEMCDLDRMLKSVTSKEILGDICHGKNRI